MKAWVLHGIDDLRFEEIEKPCAKVGEVLVKVGAVGVCGSDVPRVYQTGMYSHPLIPGHEFSGQVVSVGTDVATGLIGKRVGVFPLVPCRQCKPCRIGSFEMCRNYGYLGSRNNGGFAEYVAVPADNLIELPNNVSFEVAAMLEPMAVAVHSIRRADVDRNDSIGIIGLGTIGLFVAMFLRAMGYNNILAVGNKEFQKNKALEIGISEDCYCDAKNIDVSEWLKFKTSGYGVDVLFECVGSNVTISQGVEAVSPAGMLVLVGNPHSDIQMDKNVYWKILRNQLTVLGTWNSSFTGEEDDDWHYVMDMLKNGDVKPDKMITHRVEINELSKGLELMRDKKEDYIKVMISLPMKDDLI